MGEWCVPCLTPAFCLDNWWRLVALTLTLIVGYHNQKCQRQSETMLELTTTSKRPCNGTHKTEVQAFLKAYRINQIQCNFKGTSKNKKASYSAQHLVIFFLGNLCVAKTHLSLAQYEMALCHILRSFIAQKVRPLEFSVSPCATSSSARLCLEGF